MKKCIILLLIVILVLLTAKTACARPIDGTTVDEVPYISEFQYETLVRIVEAEATGCSVVHKRNVANNIIARVQSPDFPTRISDVVFQKSQYSPISDGRYWEVNITEETVYAVNQALLGYGRHNGTFFLVKRWSDPNNVEWFEESLEFAFNDGIHDYYTEKR